MERITLNMSVVNLYSIFEKKGSDIISIYKLLTFIENNADTVNKITKQHFILDWQEYYKEIDQHFIDEIKQELKVFQSKYEVYLQSVRNNISHLFNEEKREELPNLTEFHTGHLEEIHVSAAKILNEITGRLYSQYTGFGEY